MFSVHLKTSEKIGKRKKTKQKQNQEKKWEESISGIKIGQYNQETNKQTNPKTKTQGVEALQLIGNHLIHCNECRNFIAQIGPSLGLQ